MCAGLGFRVYGLLCVCVSVCVSVCVCVCVCCVCVCVCVCLCVVWMHALLTTCSTQTDTHTHPSSLPSHLCCAHAHQIVIFSQQDRMSVGQNVQSRVHLKGKKEKNVVRKEKRWSERKKKLVKRKKVRNVQSQVHLHAVCV